MKRNILVTGATGFLGSHLVKALLEKTEFNIYALSRNKYGIAYDQRGGVDYDNDRLKVIEGDLTESEIFPHAESFPIHFDTIIHSGGITDFKEEHREKTFKINLEGTKKLLSFAKKNKCNEFWHISTAYVSGMYDGIVHEDKLLENPKFRNSYEESKYFAEKEVRASGLNYKIFRPSVIMGDTETGDCDSDKMVYGVIKLYDIINKVLSRSYNKNIPKGIKYYIKGVSNSLLNLISVNNVVDLILKIGEYGEVNKAFHLTNPNYASVEDIHNYVKYSVGVDYIELKEKLPETVDKIQMKINSSVKIYDSYMTVSDPTFDLKNTLEVVGDRYKFDFFDKKLQVFLYSKYLKERRKK